MTLRDDLRAEVERRRGTWNSKWSVEKLREEIEKLPEPEEKRLPYCDGTAGSWGNSTFRAERLALDHPALVGRDLTPKGALEG